LAKKRRQVELPDYPEVLLKPLPSPATADQIAPSLDALIKHYGIGASSHALTANPYLESGTAKKRFPWEELAQRLMQDFVPAFKNRKRKTAPKQGVHLLYPHAHEAWLVRLVDAHQAKLKAKDATATRSAAFDALLETLRRHPAPSWRFGKVKKQSLAQAWKGIDRDVKRNPNKYLPPKPQPAYDGPGISLPIAGHEVGRDFLTGKILFDSSVSSEDREFWDSMPPLPMEPAR
jgi:hypothetical protein